MLIDDLSKQKNSTYIKQSCSYFASSTSAKTPAASGAAADVPECFNVH